MLDTDILPELCHFEEELVIGPFKRRVSTECMIPFEDPIEVQIMHCFDEIMRRESLPYPFFEPLKQQLRTWLLSEIDRLGTETANKQRAAVDASNHDWRKHVLEFRDMLNTLEFVNDERDEKELTFDEKFRFVMENVDSSKLQMIVAKEGKMAEERIALIRARDFELEQLTKACEAAVNDSIDKREELEQVSYNLGMLNEKLKKVNANYNLQLLALADRQRTEYRAMITELFETDSIPEHIRAESPPASLIRKITTSELPNGETSTTNSKATGLRDESFTIHIGSQVKTPHNMRIMQANSLVDRLSPFHEDGLHGEHDYSQRLHTLMNLYGAELSAVVLLVERDPLYHLHNRTTFFRICERTSELHFDPLEVQLSKNAAQTAEINSKRKHDLPESTSYDLPAACSKFDEQLCDVGDVYVTKHSNLNNAHIVFHLVVDSTLEIDELASRNSIMLGVRKIFQAASMYNIRSITFPLLLVEHTTESMTVQWCLRRTDLVFKCIKGFMMEFCSNADRTSVLFPGSREPIQAHYTINFMLPSKLSHSVFDQIVDQFALLYSVRVTKIEGTLEKSEDTPKTGKGKEDVRLLLKKMSFRR
uniref:Macro domain-containing protein n=1 Tax=Panagrellus redivivus TaxID=6233 RepID=A0A7E4W010_PANRE